MVASELDAARTLDDSRLRTASDDTIEVVKV